jgi:hypothetical protein
LQKIESHFGDDGGAGPAARAKLIQPVLAAQSFCAPIQQEF